MGTGDLQAYQQAGLLLVASPLYDACRFAVDVLRNLSSEQFTAGGDECARERLEAALEMARDAGYISAGWSIENINREIEDGIKKNAARTT